MDSFQKNSIICLTLYINCEILMIVQVNNYIKGCKVGIKIILEDNPVIAAVKDEEQLKKASDSNVQIIFVLWGDLLNITKISEEIYSHNKWVYFI